MRNSSSTSDWLELSLSIVIGVVTIVVVHVFTTPVNTAQNDAATMFAGAWGREEMAASIDEKPVWAVYRECWTQSDTRPFQGEGPEVNSWKEPPASVSLTPPDLSMTGSTKVQVFTAEDLFEKCSNVVQTAYPNNSSVSIVKRTILKLLQDRESDAQAWGDPHQSKESWSAPSNDSNIGMMPSRDLP